MVRPRPREVSRFLNPHLGSSNDAEQFAETAIEMTSEHQGFVAGLSSLHFPDLSDQPETTAEKEAREQRRGGCGAEYWGCSDMGAEVVGEHVSILFVAVIAGATFCAVTLVLVLVFLFD